ncbi:hypothetical protein [Pontimicrobium sp. IMCC45349]|uniref:hypothetical protein n=1 Tax=Pontimicrobium sp. IMCC45349 TaxID=3391574 RepID=UPI0039A326CB
MRNVNPDGLLLKSDITFNNLFEAINTVIEEPPFYSKQVIKLLRKQAANDTILDNIDRRLLYELSIGARMKDLPNIIPLTIAGIERRKRKLKEAFNTQKDDDKELLEIARKKGFI